MDAGLSTRSIFDLVGSTSPKNAESSGDMCHACGFSHPWKPEHECVEDIQGFCETLVKSCWFIKDTFDMQPAEAASGLTRNTVDAAKPMRSVREYREKKRLLKSSSASTEHSIQSDAVRSTPTIGSKPTEEFFAFAKNVVYEAIKARGHSAGLGGAGFEEKWKGVARACFSSYWERVLSEEAPANVFGDQAAARIRVYVDDFLSRKKPFG